MEPTRRGLLFSGAAAGLTFAAGARAAPSSTAPKYLITLLARGGWDVTYCLDPKLGEPLIEGPEVDASTGPDDVEAVKTFGGIEVVVNEAKRPAVNDWFETWHNRAQVVNGIWMGSIAHDPCRFRILTGTTYSSKPDFATIAGYRRSETEPLGSIDLSGWSMAGQLAASTGSIGWESQLKVLIDPATQVTAPGWFGRSYPLFAPVEDDRAAAAAFLRARTEAFGLTRADGGRSDARISDLLESWDRAERFRGASGDIADLLPLGRQPDLPLQIDIAVESLKLGLCRAVTLESGMDWDTHDDNPLQHGYYENLFVALGGLAQKLEDEGMLDQTLVAVVSEMTRTPLVNGTGKDHWPHTSALFFGGGIRGGVQTGGTDHQLESFTMDLETGVPYADRNDGELLKYENLCAGILEFMDVDSEEWLPGVAPYRGFGV